MSQDSSFTDPHQWSTEQLVAALHHLAARYNTLGQDRASKIVHAAAQRLHILHTERKTPPSKVEIIEGETLK